MPFRRFVETGRVAYISSGRYAGRLCSIIDVIDQTRALVEGPESKVPRIGIRFAQLRLTKYRMKFSHMSGTSHVRKVWKENKILEKWKDSTWAKKIADKRKRRSLTDFDRFKLRNARKARNSIRTAVYSKMYKEDRQKREKLRRDNKGVKGYNRRVRKPKPAKEVKKDAKDAKTTKPAKK